MIISQLSVFMGGGMVKITKYWDLPRSGLVFTKALAWSVALGNTRRTERGPKICHILESRHLRAGSSTLGSVTTVFVNPDRVSCPCLASSLVMTLVSWVPEFCHYLNWQVVNKLAA